MIRSMHVIGSRGPGGAERFYTRLLGALQACGQPVLAVCPPQSAVARALDADVPQLHLRMRGIWDLAARRAIARTAREFQADIVQTYLGRATRLTRLRYGVRPVHVARLGGYYDLKGYRHAHAWVGNTRQICAYLIDHGLPAARVSHIGNFVDSPPALQPGQLADLRAELDLPADARVILGVGRLHPIKGFGDLIDAFSLLAPRLAGQPLYLCLVGGGPLRAELQQRCAQLGIATRVRWAGWQEDTSPYFQLASVLICPSHQEGLGGVILEAWAHHLPVIATRAQGPSELITDGANGRLVPIADRAALARAITDLLGAGPGVAAALAAAGGERLQAEHSRESVINAYLNLYSRLLAALG